MIVIGVDPGKSGGLAAINKRGIVDCIPMPVSSDGLVDSRAVAEWIRGVSAPAWAKDDRGNDTVDREVSVWIEDVHAMPGQGVCSMFSFGRSLGNLEGVCGALGMAVHRVRPQAWVKEAGEVLGCISVDCGGSGKGSAKNKGKSAVWAKRIWTTANLLATPRSKVAHDGMADALLIAWFGLRFQEKPGEKMNLAEED
jgi:crossover junction endodeoxyribonuclease RuvC